MSSTFVPKVLFFLIQLTVNEESETLDELFRATQGHRTSEVMPNRLQAVSIELLGFYCQRFPEFAQFVQHFVKELLLILNKALPVLDHVPGRNEIIPPTKARNASLEKAGGHPEGEKKPAKK